MATHAQLIHSSGQLFEAQLQATIERCGYVFLDNNESSTQPYYKRQFSNGLLSLYGKVMRTDFYCWHPIKHPNGLLVEAKYQGANGSVDEKYPYLVLSLKQQAIPSVLVLEGGGATRKSIEWCLEQNSATFTAFDGLTPFIHKANRGFL
jgi:hypothetical protein